MLQRPEETEPEKRNAVRQGILYSSDRTEKCMKL